MSLNFMADLNLGIGPKGKFFELRRRDNHLTRLFADKGRHRIAALHIEFSKNIVEQQNRLVQVTGRDIDCGKSHGNRRTAALPLRPA